MIIEDGKFYFIKDEFFNVFKGYKLMENKESGNKRPCYFCFRDRKNKDIVWFVPISTKYEKYKKIYEDKKSKVGNRPVYNFVFGNVSGKKAVFLIQNIFLTERILPMNKCKDCQYKCFRVEDEDFKGVWRCEYYIEEAKDENNK